MHYHGCVVKVQILLQLASKIINRRVRYKYLYFTFGKVYTIYYILYTEGHRFLTHSFPHIPTLNHSYYTKRLKMTEECFMAGYIKQTELKKYQIFLCYQ